MHGRAVRGCTRAPAEDVLQHVCPHAHGSTAHLLSRPCCRPCSPRHTPRSSPRPRLHMPAGHCPPPPPNTPCAFVAVPFPCSNSAWLIIKQHQQGCPLQELGAERAIDYTRERFEEVCRQPFDAILDLVGGESLRLALVGGGGGGGGSLWVGGVGFVCVGVGGVGWSGWVDGTSLHGWLFV